MQVAKTPARQSKRARGLDVSPAALLIAAHTAAKAKKAAKPAASDDEEMTDAPAAAPPASPTVAPQTASKSKRKAKPAASDDEAEETPSAAAAAVAATPAKAAPATAGKAKRAKKDAEPTVDAPSEGARATASVSSSASLSSLSGLLASVMSPSADSVLTATELRTLQQAILKIATAGTPAELINEQLWRAFLVRLQALQANTVRVDLQLLLAIGRTFAEAAAAPASESAAGVLATLRALLALLLPSSSTPAAASWSTTFRPTYDYFLAFLGGVVRTVVDLDARAADPEVWQMVIQALDAYTLINAAQNAQRKVYDAALQERALPVWAQLHLQIEEAIRTTTTTISGQPQMSESAKEAARTAADKLESVIGSVLFHSEHLNLYADALGGIGLEEEEEDDEDDQAEAEKAKADKKDSKKDDTAAEQASSADDTPASKKAKVDGASSKAKAAKSPAVHKPHPANYTKKLFDAVENWITREETMTTAAGKKSTPVSENTEMEDAAGAKKADKKRKSIAPPSTAAPAVAAPAAGSSVPVVYTARALRSALPLLFSGYMRASDGAFDALYPSGAAAATTSHTGAEYTPHVSASEARKKQARERVKEQREMQFLQKMWQMNEQTTKAPNATGPEANGSAKSPAGGSVASPSSGLAPIFTVGLTSSSLPLVHDVFATNAELFRLIARHDMYKIHQDANSAIGSGGSTATLTSTFTGFKKILADQAHKVMRVARVVVKAALGKEEKRKSKAPAVAGAESTPSPSALLSLSSVLSSNLLHLLQLNPEFLLSYLYVRAGSDAESANHHQAKINVWHLIWLVTQMSEVPKSPATSEDTHLAVVSPASGALAGARSLAAALLRSFFKLRQYDVLFHSYLSAAISAHALAPALLITPFSVVAGPEGANSLVDLPSLMRNIPPLKVPSLWEWFLARAKEMFAPPSSDESTSVEPSAAARESLVHFFVFFLTSMLVREEIALSLQALYAKSVAQIIAPRLRSIRAEAEGFSRRKLNQSALSPAGPRGIKGPASDAKATTEPTAEVEVELASLAPSSLFLLMHSLNVVKQQGDQHTTKTYETMLQPLPAYFAAIDESASAGAPATAAAESTRLTDVLHHLAADAAEDPTLLHALHLVTMQRLQQLARFQSRNLMTNHFADDERGSRSDSDNDADSDDDEATLTKKAVAKKAAADARLAVGFRAPQTHLEEAHALTSFLLEHEDTCACFAAPSADAHARFAWSGSLILHGVGQAATALWSLVTRHMDVVANFATADQRVKLIERLVAITACRFCRADELEKRAAHSSETPDAPVSAPATASSVGAHTLSSLSSGLLSQPWFYEIPSIRHVLMDVMLRRLVTEAYQCTGGAKKTHKDTKATPKKKVDSSSAAAASSLRVPAIFPLTVEVSSELTALRALAEQVSGGSAVQVAAPASGRQSVWDALWTLQLAHALPSQYLASQPLFHALLTQVAWSLECIAATQTSGGATTVAAEPLTLRDLCLTPLSTIPSASLYSHLALSARRTLVACVTALVHTPSYLVAAFTPTFTEWVCFGLGQTTVLRGRHVGLAQEETRRAVKQIAPALMASATTASSKADKTPVATVPPFQAVLTRLSALLSSPSSIDAAALSWSLRLASAIAESFLPEWSSASGVGGASTDSLSRAHKVLTRDAPGWEAAAAEWLTRVKKWLKIEATQGESLELYALLMLNVFAGRDAKEAKPMEESVTANIASALALASAELSTPSLHGRRGALTFLQALCTMQPALPTTGATSFDGLFQTLQTVLTSNAAAGGATKAILQSSFLQLMSHASPDQCDRIIDVCLAALDPSYAWAEPATEADRRLSVGASLTFLHVYLSHAHTTAQRRAMSHPRMSLLLFRLASHSTAWATRAAAGQEDAAVAVRSAQAGLQVLSVILSRHQVYLLDDQAVALLAHTLNQCASMLREESYRAPQAGRSPAASAVVLAHPFYLALYSLLKYHAGSLVKILPVYLGLLKALLAYQWRQVQSSSAGRPVPVVSSENVARVLEELGRTANAKLVNKYLVGLLLDWIHISKQRGSVPQAQQEMHQKAINKGWFAIINLCEEHDLSYLHNLLDPAGRALFRTLRQAYKKTRFTGQV